MLIVVLERTIKESIHSNLTRQLKLYTTILFDSKYVSNIFVKEQKDRRHVEDRLQNSKCKAHLINSHFKLNRND